MTRPIAQPGPDARRRLDDEALPPELLQIIEALAEDQARRDYARDHANQPERQ